MGRAENLAEDFQRILKKKKIRERGRGRKRQIERDREESRAAFLGTDGFLDFFFH